MLDEQLEKFICVKDEALKRLERLDYFLQKEHDKSNPIYILTKIVRNYLKEKIDELTCVIDKIKYLINLN